MHTSIMCINILQNDKAVALKLQEELTGQTMFPLCSQYEKNYQVQLPVILRIFEENQNPVDMHISIMCIKIIQNIKAVAPKLQEEIARQTMYLYPDGRTDGWMNRGKLICPPTLRHGSITFFLHIEYFYKLYKIYIYNIFMSCQNLYNDHWRSRFLVLLYTTYHGLVS